jgi:GNAT superfamily N-acetyltransferase
MGVQLIHRIDGRNVVFTVEIATLEHDLTKAATLINSAYKKVKYLQDGIERTTPLDLREAISHPNKRLYFCILPSQEICGTILLDFFERDKAEIGLFAIDPNCRGYKIGPVFMSYVEQEAFKKVHTIILKVIPLFQEKLIQFYKGLGYRATGEKIAFPEEDKQRYIRPECRDQVYFSIMEKTRIRSAF